MHTVVDAINTLEVVVKGNESRVTSNGLYYTPNLPLEDRFCIVGSALNHLGVTVADLIVMGPLSIDFLYEQDRVPFPLSLGAMLVYRAAQRTQDGLVGEDRSWGAAFDSAVVAASRVIDLIPDSAVAAARAELVSS